MCALELAGDGRKTTAPPPGRQTQRRCRRFAGRLFPNPTRRRYHSEIIRFQTGQSAGNGIPETRAGLANGVPARRRPGIGREVFRADKESFGGMAGEFAGTDPLMFREELTLRAIDHDVLVKEIVLFEGRVPGAKTVGTVDGSPVVAGNFFLGYEHPMARNAVGADSAVRCSFTLATPS